MDVLPGTDNPRKRRRSDEEARPRTRETISPDTIPDHRTGDGYNTTVMASHQFPPLSRSQWDWVPPQSDDGPSTSTGHPMPQEPQEPAESYHQVLPKSLSQQFSLAPNQVPSSVQPWQDAVFIEAQFPPTIMPPPGEPGSEKVCFGVVPSIAARCNSTMSLNTPSSPFPVRIMSCERFQSDENPNISGYIFSENGQMIQGLLDEGTLDLYVSCTIQDSQSSAPQNTRSTPLQCTLEITVYGPLELFEEIGTWFEDYQIYLQDPRECHLNVRYCNPHRLSSEDIASCPFVLYAIHRPSPLHLETIPQQEDLLDILANQDNIEETAQPTVIKGSLRRHQKQALTFMLRREQGWAFYDERPDVWEMIDTDQGRIFLNRISNAHQSEEPPQCYGGIIADPAGLGKTLTMIALAATDMERSDTDMDTSEDGQLNVPATLIVVPPPLIHIWEKQLSEHIAHGGMTWHRHHREIRLSSIAQFDRLNIVLTTYQTVSAEWSSGNGSGSSTLFSVRWRRIILDEAHLIRNVSSNISQAVCALESKSRWAVTSTPILARLGDLATLFKFIRAHPYTNHRCFDADISRLWKSSHYEEAIKRLKRLSACMLLRRPKGSIDLPARRDMQCLVNFSIEEEAVYDNLRQKIDLSIERALHGDSGSSQAGIYVNILQQIESLRLVCNLGLHNSMRYGQVPLASLEDGNWANIAQETFNLQRALGPLSCSQCRSTLEIAETPLEHPSVPQQNAQFSSCLKFVCTDCTQRFFQVGYAVECGHSCPTAAISTESSVLESTLDEVQQQTRPTYRGLSSKVGALITDINALPRQEKCIVFSAWRVTLDMVEAGLEQASISNVRFDGKVPQSDRQNIVETFMTDPSIRVMLLTLYCDTAGLTLTVATRAYLMEPHWNPTFEEQALARIHRIGQALEVTTVRFCVRDSIEQRFIDAQEPRKHLGGLLLSSDGSEQADEIRARLETLRSLI